MGAPDLCFRGLSTGDFIRLKDWLKHITVCRFYCESGAMMEGSSAVYCDGYSWNGTKPECLGKATWTE